MVTKSMFMLMALAATALAGCASDEKPQETGPDFGSFAVEADDKTGVIRGLVVDAAIMPIAGVQVTVSGEHMAEPVVRETDEGGLFLFSKLEPGVYTVEASKAGYTASRTATSVMAGVAEPDILKLLLEADPTSLPYAQLYAWDGFIECSFSLVLVRFAACSDVGNDDFIEEYTFEGMPDHVQSEMIWDSTQSLGDKMQLSVTDISTGVQVRINASSGQSPVLLGINRTQIEQFGIGVNNTPWWRVFNEAREETDVAPDEEIQDAYGSTVYPVYNGTAPQPVKDELYFVSECVEWPVLFSACMGAGGIGATIQQEFTVYTHVFYNFLPESGWQFSVDGAPQAPQ